MKALREYGSAPDESLLVTRSISQEYPNRFTSKVSYRRTGWRRPADERTHTLVVSEDIFLERHKHAIERKSHEIEKDREISFPLFPILRRLHRTFLTNFSLYYSYDR